jgi:hypothetical protein
VIDGDLVDEPTGARHVGKQDPAGAARQSVRQRDELGAPAVDGTEIADDRARDHVGQRPPVATQACKIQFVQQRCVQRVGPLAVQASDEAGRCLCHIDVFEFGGESVEPVQRGAVIVLVMALDETRRDAVQW